MAEPSILRLRTGLDLQALNGGFFLSRGEGIHPDRQIASYELIFVRKGALSIQEEDRSFEVREGQSLLLWPSRRHRGTAPFPADLAFYWLHFTASATSRGSDSGVLTVLQHVTVSRPDHMSELFRRY